MKALAASGLPLNVPSVPSSTPSSSSSSSDPSAPATSGQFPPTTTFPVFVPPSPVFPISPAPSHTSSGSSTLFDSDDFDSTRHLARVATIEPSGLMSLQRVDSLSSATMDIRRRKQALSAVPVISRPPASPMMTVTILDAMRMQRWRTCSGRSLLRPLHRQRMTRQQSSVLLKRQQQMLAMRFGGRPMPPKRK